jgi:hypothetical protein
MREKLSRRQITKDKKAASPAISMVIITAATVVLVLVAGSFAVQVLDRQQAATEFNALQKSILALDDAVRDVAWKEGASRSVRFATGRGSFRTASTTRFVEINFNGTLVGTPFQTSAITYVMSDSYITLESEQSYILGDADPAVSSVSDSLGQVSLAHESGFASINLGYRLRVSNEGEYQVKGVSTTYVNILIIELSSTDLSFVKGDFDLVAKNTGVNTISSNPFPINSEGYYPLNFSIDEGAQDFSLLIHLTEGQTIFNLIIGEVRVSI